MQRMAQEQLDDHFPGTNLGGQSPQAALIGIGGHAKGKLVLEFFSQLLFPSKGGLIVDAFVGVHHAQGLVQFCLRQTLHAHQQAAAVSIAAGPALDELVNLLPAAEVEVADAEIGAIGQGERLAQGREQGLVDVVKDARHSLATP
jgi:hypothetical protein